MSKTKLPPAVVHRLMTIAVIAGLAFAFSEPVLAQTAAADITISDLANAQKAKLKDEIAKAQGLPTQQDRLTAEAQTAAARTVKTRPVSVFVPSVAVHSVYTTLNGARVVELTDGRNLFSAKTGARYGKWIITDVTDAGVTLARAGCKKKCGAGRTVAVGGAF